MKKINNTISHYSDYELVQTAQAGDQTAVAELYHRYFAALYRFCYWQTNKSLDAEDIAQDVMMAMVRTLPNFRFTASFRNYLYAIAKKQIAAWLHKKYQLPTTQYEEFLQEIGDDDSWLDTDNQAKKRKSIARLLAKLKPREQRVLQLRYLHGMSQAEVAAQLQLSVANIKVLCHRSLKKLAQLVQSKPVTKK